MVDVAAILKGIRTTPDGGWVLSFEIDASQGNKVVTINELRDQVLYLTISDAKLDTN